MFGSVFAYWMKIVYGFVWIFTSDLQTHKN